MVDSQQKREIFLPRSRWDWCECEKEKLNEVQLLIVDYREKQVLLCRDGGDWILPGYVRAFGMTYNGTVVLVQRMRDDLRLNFDPAVLCAVWEESKSCEHSNSFFSLEKCVVLVHCLEKGTPCPSEFVWVPLQEAVVEHLFPSAAEAIRSEIRNALSGVVPPAREPWARPGWFANAVSWMEDMLKCKRGVELQRPVIQHQTTNMGVVIKANTAQGSYYLKCTSFSNDAGVTETLSRIAPKYVARPVAVDRDVKMMVTDEYGEICGLCELECAEIHRAAKDFAKLQQATIGRTGELLEAGALDMSPNRMIRELEHILGHRLLLDRDKTVLAEIQDLKHYVETLKTLTAQACRV